MFDVFWNPVNKPALKAAFLTKTVQASIPKWAEVQSQKAEVQSWQKNSDPPWNNKSHLES